MQSLDFSKFLDLGYSAAMPGLTPQDTSAIDDVYARGEGLLLRSQGRRKELIQDIVRLSDGALLFASDHSGGGAPPHSQLVTESDWIHIQLRMSGGGSERISESGTISTPERSCVVSRYARNVTVERTIDAPVRWKAVCLLINPRALTTLLDVPANALSPSTQWIGQTGSLKSQTHIVPLQPAMLLAANDILSCPLRGPIRRSFMRAKALELITAVIGALDSAPNKIRFTERELQKLTSARKIMEAELGSKITVVGLAKRLNISPNRLRQLFDIIHNTTVAAYWRDIRLTHARSLLHEGRARATDVALQVGYDNASSFSRAFYRKFRVLPKDARSAAHLPDGS